MGEQLSSLRGVCCFSSLSGLVLAHFTASKPSLISSFPSQKFFTGIIHPLSEQYYFYLVFLVLSRGVSPVYQEPFTKCLTAPNNSPTAEPMNRFPGAQAD